jgi:GTPase
MLVVGSGGSIGTMTVEHLAIVRALDIPFFIVVTKTDLTPPAETVLQLKQLLVSVGCRYEGE